MTDKQKQAAKKVEATKQAEAAKQAEELAVKQAEELAVKQTEENKAILVQGLDLKVLESLGLTSAELNTILGKREKDSREQAKKDVFDNANVKAIKFYLASLGTVDFTLSFAKKGNQCTVKMSGTGKGSGGTINGKPKSSYAWLKGDGEHGPMNKVYRSFADATREFECYVDNASQKDILDGLGYTVAYVKTQNDVDEDTDISPEVELPTAA